MQPYPKATKPNVPSHTPGHTYTHWARLGDFRYVVRSFRRQLVYHCAGAYVVSNCTTHRGGNCWHFKPCRRTEDDNIKWSAPLPHVNVHTMSVCVQSPWTTNLPCYQFTPYYQSLSLNDNGEMKLLGLPTKLNRKTVLLREWKFPVDWCTHL